MARKSIPGDWLDLRRLRYFIQIAEARSYSKAAIGLAVGQPALSRYIRDIENDIGITLFYRDGRGVKLTDAGQRLYTRGQEILARVEAAKSELANLKGVLTGSISLAIQPSLGRLLTAPIARRIVDEFPQVRLHITEGMSGHILGWLASGSVDIALHYDQPNLSRIPRERLAAQDLLLVGPRNANLSLSQRQSFFDIVKLPLILPGKPHSLRVSLDALAAKKGVSFHVPVEVDSASGIVELIEQGMGYGILPMASFSKALHEGSVSASWIVKPQITRILLMMTASHQPVTPLARKVMEIIRQEARTVAARAKDLAYLPKPRSAQS